MNLDTANRNFYGLLTLAAAPFLLAGALGCGVLTLTAYRIVTNGRTDALTGPTAIPAGLFLTAAALGALLAMRSLIVQHRATRRLAGHLRSRWIPPTERLQDIAAEAGLVRVNLVDDGDAYSLTFGLLRPRVVISRGLVDRSSDRELAAVLVHERYHVANLDPLKITLARAVTAGFFFLPATNHLLSRYLAGRELNADRHALRQCGRTAIAGALLQVVGGPTDLSLSAAAALGGNEMLGIRIDQIETSAEPTLPSIPSHVIALTIAGFVAVSAGLIATVIAVDTPSILNPTSGDGRIDLVGGLACAAMWTVGGLALRNHRRQPRTT